MSNGMLFLWLWFGWIGFWLVRFWQVNEYNKVNKSPMYVFTYGTVLASFVFMLLGFGLAFIGFGLALFAVEWDKVVPIDKIMTFLQTPIFKDKDNDKETSKHPPSDGFRGN